jgi:fructose-1,6-bisphosphatase I
MTPTTGEALRTAMTVEHHILKQQKSRFPDASGEFSWLLSGITLATKLIAAVVRRAGLSDQMGAAGSINVQGEQQQKLDVFANQALLNCLEYRSTVAALASEENEEPVVVLDNAESGRYVVIFDPLDGSSNIDLNISVGTIFAVFRHEPGGGKGAAADVLQPGAQQVAAGYVLYGSSTMLVYSSGEGVHGFTLEPSIGAYLLSHPNLRMPARGSIYSVNEANADGFPEYCRRFLHWLKSGDDDTHYSSRYIGSLVADFHRTLMKGGIFLYPPTDQYAQGKLRLMYEANPIAYLAEQAGGMATDGRRRILEIEPENLHQRTPLYVGSPYEIERLLTFAKKNGRE